VTVTRNPRTRDRALHRGPTHGETPPLILERLRVADNPQQTIRELKELVIAYAKQETVDPLKGLVRYVAFGIAGAILIGAGVTFLAIGSLRALQGDQRGPHFTGNWSWAPYGIVVVGALAIAALTWVVGTKRKKS
jgi:Putative Actinobacterial Holin-X, holin superfamily III